MSIKKIIITSLKYTIIAVSVGLAIVTSPYYISEIVDKLEQAQKVRIANKNHQLDGVTPHYIDKNVVWKDVFPAGVFYVLVPSSVPENERAAFDFVEGKKIGKSSVDLDAYLGKLVTVKGEYYYGEPLALQGVKGISVLNQGHIEPQLIINIQEVRVVE
jgi:hypothetical protein